MNNNGNKLVANIFKTLAHPIRLQILLLLKDGPLCVRNILPELALEVSNASQHLSILKNQGILDSQKDGAKTIYSIKSPEVYEMINAAESIILRQVEGTKDYFKVRI